MLKICFRRQFFLFFGPWTPDFAVFDRKVGFYVKFPPRDRLERSRESGIQIQEMRTCIFKYGCILKSVFLWPGSTAQCIYLFSPLLFLFLGSSFLYQRETTKYSFSCESCRYVLYCLIFFIIFLHVYYVFFLWLLFLF